MPQYKLERFTNGVPKFVGDLTHQIIRENKLDINAKQKSELMTDIYQCKEEYFILDPNKYQNL